MDRAATFSSREGTHGGPGKAALAASWCLRGGRKALVPEKGGVVQKAQGGQNRPPPQKPVTRSKVTRAWVTLRQDSGNSAVITHLLRNYIALY